MDRSATQKLAYSVLPSTKTVLEFEAPGAGTIAKCLGRYKELTGQVKHLTGDGPLADAIRRLFVLAGGSSTSWIGDINLNGHPTKSNCEVTR